MEETDQQALRALVTGQRQAALATLADGLPFASMVLYALDYSTPTSQLLIHVSRLAAHTRQLQDNPQASLLIMQPDIGAADPQSLPRATIQVVAQALPAGDSAYPSAKAAYLQALPQQSYLFEFPDFMLFRLRPLKVRYVGGFAKAFSLNAEQFAAALNQK